MTVHKYTDQEIQFLRDNQYGISRKDLCEKFNERFHTDLSVNSIKRTCLRYGLKNGIDGRFKKGDTSFNKGRKMVFRSETTRKNSRKHCFKKGNVPHNYLPVGAEVVDSLGYVEVKINDLPHAPHNRNWKFKHRLLWEQERGEIPEGYQVVFVDGNNRNFDIDNLMLVPNGTLGVANGFDKTGDVDLDKSVLLMSSLIMETRKKERK